MKKNFLFSAIILLFIAAPCLNAQEPISANGRFTTVNGAKIYYEEYGQGAPLFLLHGFGRTASDWKAFIPELSKHYRIIAWDMRGHGRSTNPDTTNVFLHAVAAQDLLMLMDNLKIEKAKVIGHSSGGIIALYVAHLQPERFEAIVPVSAQLNFSTETREFIEHNAKPEDFYIFNDGEKLHGAEKGMQLAYQFYNFRNLTGDPNITSEQLSKIRARTLIVHGDNDFVPVSNAWEMFTTIPNAHLFIVPNGWHMPHEGPLNSADFIRRTLEFLNDDWNRQD